MTRSDVLMDYIVLHRAVQSGAVGDRGSAALLGIAGGSGLLDALGEGLEAGLNVLVARCIPEGFAGGFEC